MKKKQGFSLVELLVALIAISCIIAAFAPVMTKRMNNRIGVSNSKNKDTYKLFLTNTMGCSEGENNTKICTFKVPNGVTKLNAVLVAGGSGGGGARKPSGKISTQGDSHTGTFYKYPPQVVTGMSILICGGGGAGGHGYYSEAEKGCSKATYSCKSGPMLDNKTCLEKHLGTCTDSMANGIDISGYLTRGEFTLEGPTWSKDCMPKNTALGCSSYANNSGATTNVNCSTQAIYYTFSTDGPETTYSDLGDSYLIDNKCYIRKRGSCSNAMADGAINPISYTLSGKIPFRDYTWAPNCMPKNTALGCSAFYASNSTNTSNKTCTDIFDYFITENPTTTNTLATYGGGGGASGSCLLLTENELGKLPPGTKLTFNTGANGVATSTPTAGGSTSLQIDYGYSLNGGSGNLIRTWVAGGGGAGKSATEEGHGLGGDTGYCSEQTLNMPKTSGEVRPISCTKSSRGGIGFLGRTGGGVGGCANITLTSGSDTFTNCGGNGGARIPGQPSVYSLGKDGTPGYFTIRYDTFYMGSSGGGGASGGLIHAKQISVTPGSTCTITVGKGGRGGNASSDGEQGGLSRIVCDSTTIQAGSGPRGSTGKAQEDLYEDEATMLSRMGYILTDKATTNYPNSESAEVDYEIVKFVNPITELKSYKNHSWSKYTYASPLAGKYYFRDEKYFGGNGMPAPMADESDYACGGYNILTPCTNTTANAQQNKAFKKPDIGIDDEIDYGLAGAGGAGGGYENTDNLLNAIYANGADGQDGYVLLYWK